MNRKCEVCAFSDKQEDIIQISGGYAHQECLADKEEEAQRCLNKTERLIEKGYSPLENCYG